ncbi:MAG: hypothetical protein IPI73_24780 [Betaproteobacteria bacterium]|nr:hypothetical protein [Betaproteobacteria bacterium]
MMVASRFNATLFVLTMIVAVIPAAVRGAVPHVLNFQGYLTTSNGTPVTATVSMQFKLYASDTGGSPIYSETQPSVAVTNGRFDVVIGTQDPIPDNIPFDQPYWLAITVGGDAEMEPRQLLGRARMQSGRRRPKRSAPARQCRARKSPERSTPRLCPARRSPDRSARRHCRQPI